MRDNGKITYYFFPLRYYNETIKIPHLCEKKWDMLRWFRDECGIPYLPPKDNVISVFMDMMKKDIICPKCQKKYKINIIDDIEEIRKT